jgi:CheY-like chemotaxis protein
MPHPFAGATNELQPMVRSRPDQAVILVVDDEPLILNIARTVLEREGYFILTAANGEEALLLSQAYPGTIQLLLTDIIMPGISGLELSQRLLADRPAISVLLMSGQVELPVEAKLLRKPFSIGLLKERVRQILSLTSSGAPVCASRTRGRPLRTYATRRIYAPPTIGCISRYCPAPTRVGRLWRLR